MPSVVEKRAQELVDAHGRLQRATRRAFPHGECSYDPEWIAACRALDAAYRSSAVMVARAFLRVANAPERASVVSDAPTKEPGA